MMSSFHSAIILPPSVLPASFALTIHTLSVLTLLCTMVIRNKAKLPSSGSSSPRKCGLQAEGRDPDNSTDLLGVDLPFVYSWTVLGPGGLPLTANLSQSLYTPAALEDGLLQYDANTLPVSFLTLKTITLVIQDWSKSCGLASP